MTIPFSRRALGLLAIAAVPLAATPCWAVYHFLGPSKDEWGLKYDVEVTAAEGDNVNVRFTLADAGRLTPIYSATVVAFSEPDAYGGRTYDAKVPLALKTTKDGKAVAQVQIRKQFVDKAMIRILTLTVNGRPQTAGAAYYDIPLKTILDKASVAATP
jgi:hypothetical protein